MKINGVMKLSLAALSAMMMAACSSSSSGGGSTSASTWNLSGTVSGLNAASLMSSNVGFKQEAQSYAIDLLSNNDGVHANAATQCADGKYYRVACLAWSSTSVSSAEADVSCGGASSGSFTVTGLPLNTDITCLIRKSADGTSYQPYGSIEIPSTGFTGTTDNLNAAGDMNISVAVDNTTGTITTTLVSGDNKGDDNIGTGTITPSDYNGYHSLSCDPAATDYVTCACFFFADQVAGYQGSSSDGPKDACIADNASQITNSMKMNILMRILPGTVNSNITDGSGKTILAAGQTAYAASVWQASCSSTSASSCSSPKGTGGDGLSTMNGAITWTDSSATTAVPWSYGSTSVCTANCDSGSPTNITVTIPSLSSVSTRAQWLSWISSFVGNAVSAGWVCTDWNGTTISSGQSTDTRCISRFVYDVLERNRNLVLPRLWIESCPNGTCSNTASAAMINVEGIKFDNSGNATTDGPTGATPRPRHVLEQFIPLSSGGMFKQHHDEQRWIPCKTGTGTDSDSGVYSCPTGADGIQCITSQEMGFRFIPSGTGTFAMGVEMNNTLRDGFYRGSVTGNAYDKCKSALTKQLSGKGFTAKSTLLQ